MSTASEYLRGTCRAIEREELLGENAYLRESLDKITTAVQSCHELIDDIDIYERYPNVVTAFEKIEALL
jgi:hypothetical protein